MLSVDACYLTA
ncbi:hypothetical protein D047_0890A, partial [Vibrio parahaemolyticus VPTS-2010_2]